MKTKTLLTLAMALSPFSAMGYQTADNLEQGKKLVTDDGYAIVTYARDWDKYSKKTAEQMLKDSAVTKALGNAVVMHLAVPAVSTKEENDATAARFPGMDLSFPNVYPAIILYDKTGYRLADICIPFSERNQPAVIAKKVTDAMEAMRQQAALLAKAETATGLDKARLLGEASAVPGVKRPKDIDKRIKEADPEDKTGMHQIATLNLFGRGDASGDTKDWEKDFADMQELFDHPLLTTFQKQQAYCIAIGLLRRHGGYARKAEMIAMIDKMEALDPTSVLGQSAVDARRLWIGELNILQGWTPAALPTDATPIELKGKLNISTAGTYKVVFQYTKGGEALRVDAVELYDGKQKVAEDRHFGTTGDSNSNNVYTLTVPTDIKEPHLFVIFRQETKTDSYGKITITKQ